MVKKIILRALIILALLIVLALILLPGIARRYAVKNSPELIGRQIDIQKLKVNYFSGKISVFDFEMYEADGKEKFIAFDTLIVVLKPFQLFINDLVMESFYLEGLKVKVIQYDSTFNFDDLVAFHMDETDTASSDTTLSEEPFRYDLSNIEIKNAELVFEDQNINKTTDLNDISFFIPYIGWDQSDRSEAGLKFSFKNEGYFESSISIDPIGGDYDASIRIQGLQLESFKEYVANSININHIGGVFNSRIEITGNSNAYEKSLVSGYSEVLDFELTDLNNTKFLAANKLECTIKEIDLFNMSYIIDSLLLYEPYVYFELDTVTNNFFEIFNITPNEEEAYDGEPIVSADTPGTADSIFYALNYVSIEKGAVDYRDNLTGEPFDYYLSEITLKSDSIASTSKWIDLYSNMLLNKRGTLKAQIGLDPSNPMDIKLNYVINDFMLSDLNIYSRFYMGTPIVYGDMYYKSETEILGGQLTSENKLIITHVELGEKKGGLYDLPLKFALFLLTDRDGVITLDVPVRGDLNDPSVKLGKIIWNTFKNLIVKVAAAPFDLLAGLLSVDPKDIQEIKYEYGDTTLTADRQRQLDLLLELEQKKEGLEIELIYFNDMEKEKENLALASAGKRFFDETSKNYLENKEEFVQFLNDKLQTDSLEAGPASLKLCDQATLDTVIHQLAQIRKEQIENYLHRMNDSTRIYSSFSNPESPKNVGSLPIFEVKYSMTGEIPEEME